MEEHDTAPLSSMPNQTKPADQPTKCTKFKKEHRLFMSCFLSPPLTSPPLFSLSLSLLFLLSLYTLETPQDVRPQTPRRQ